MVKGVCGIGQATVASGVGLEAQRFGEGPEGDAGPAEEGQ